MNVCEVMKHENGWSIVWSVKTPYERPRYDKKGNLVAMEPSTRYERKTAVFTDMKALLSAVRKLAETASVK